MRFWAIILALFCCCVPAQASVPLASQLCTFGTSLDGRIANVVAASEQFDCSEGKYDFSGSKLWVKVPFLDEDIPAGIVEIQGDNNGLTAMAVHSVLTNGTIRSSFFTEQQVIDSWRPKGHYGLAIPGSEDAETRSQIETVYLAIDNPRVSSSIGLIQLESKAEWDNLKLPLSAMFALLCGMAVMPFFYNAFFYSALRYSFMLWHSVMIVGTVVYTFSSSGLIFLVFPEADLTTKFLLNYWTLAISIAASGFFLDRFVEPGKIAGWLRPILLITAVLPVFVTAYLFQTIDGYSTDIRNYYHMSFVPFLLAVLFTMVHALRRGSKVIWFQIGAWTPIIAFSFDRIARGMDLYIGIHELDYGLYFALVLDTLILAFGVAHRIMGLRKDRDKARIRQKELQLLAETDGLTALANRRALERTFAMNGRTKDYTHLAMLDIDHFKQVNDVYGHEVGDHVLRAVGGQLAKTPHFAARIGGEEFVLLLKANALSTDQENATSELTSICAQLITAVHRQVPEIQRPVTLSVGLTAITKREPLAAVLAIADRRLYSAKNNGRNQVVGFDLSDQQKTQTRTATS